MSEKIRIYRKIGFQNTFYTKCINVIIESIGPSIILRSIQRCIKFVVAPFLFTLLFHFFLYFFSVFMIEA